MDLVIFSPHWQRATKKLLIHQKRFNQNKFYKFGLATSLSVFAFFAISNPVMALPEVRQYLQLKDRLDRPIDGYCLDVVGSGRHIRLDMPLTAHNCKGPQVYADEVVQYLSDQSLYFPAYEGCVTVMGLNDKALAGNALMLKRCGEVQPFLNAKKFQKFQFNEQGQVQLVGSSLCISAGQDSHTTYSPDHRWRSLLMLPCKEVALTRSVWQLVPGGY